MHLSYEVLHLVTAYRNRNKKVNTLSRQETIFQPKKLHEQ